MMPAVDGETAGPGPLQPLAPADAFWAMDQESLLARLRTGRPGLSGAEAAARLRVFGANALEERRRLDALRLLLRQFASPLVLILIFGALVSLFVREWIDASIIVAIVFGSTLLGFLQEYRASTAVAELRRRLTLTVQGRRDGKAVTLPAADLVPGDVILLSAGNLVPADGLILKATDFLVTEASLTGETFPVEKRPGVLPVPASLAERSNCVFHGTSVRSGTACVVVVRTGRDTAFGAIAARLGASPPDSDFTRGIHSFGYLLLRVMIVMVLFTLTVNLLFGRPAVDSLLFAVALAVGLSPELLPAIISVTLSAGARAMAKRGVIVRRLEAIENLGSMDVLCTDKTGTLTEGEITLDSTLDAAGRPSPDALRFGFLNAAFETGIANPLDAALVAAGSGNGLTTDGWRKIDEIPYDFVRKRLTIVVERDDAYGGERLLITKGAFDAVLAACTSLMDGGGEVPLDVHRRAALETLYREQGLKGLRLLGLAIRRVAVRDDYGRGDEEGLSFVGFLCFLDPPKADAREMVRHLGALGIKIKVISGDNRYVAAHLAEAVGLDPGAMLTGHDVAALKDDALGPFAERTDLFVEIDPQQKEQIIRALQRRGHAVGYMGDGINDAPALHTADVGISVEQAVDVARESADVVLLRKGLDVLRHGVVDGRRTFGNTLKYICITTSANFGNMISMAAATPFLPFLPLTAAQILLNNFLSDLPSMAISTDNVDRAILARPQRWRLGEIQRFMIVFGLVSTAFDLLTFALLLRLHQGNAGIFQTVWFLVSLLTELAVLLVLRTRRPALRSRPSRFLLWTTLATAVAALCIPHAAPFEALFGFTAPSAFLMACAIAIVAAYAVATELTKRWFFAHGGHTPSRPATVQASEGRPAATARPQPLTSDHERHGGR